MPNLYKELPQNYHSLIHTHFCPQNRQISVLREITQCVCPLGELLRWVALC